MDMIRARQERGVGAAPDGAMRGAFLDAVKFWEPRRVIYNVVLTGVVVAWVVVSWPHFRPAMRWESLGFLLVMALISNVLYCMAYVAEFVMQGIASGAGWKRLRWGLWSAGALLAVVLANYWIADEVYPFVR